MTYLDNLYPHIRWNGDGHAWLEDCSRTVEYDEAYFLKYVGYRGTEIAKRLNAARVALCAKHGCRTLQDWGIGSGEFIEAWRATGQVAWGYDINRSAVTWLAKRDWFCASPVGVDGVTLWDVLEHLLQPELVLCRLTVGQLLFLALPIIDDFGHLRIWKHFYPGEHLHWFTRDGLVQFVEEIGYTFVEQNDCETQAGRQDILSFVFRRN